jgi:hypothetical protein
MNLRVLRRFIHSKLFPCPSISTLKLSTTMTMRDSLYPSKNLISPLLTSDVYAAIRKRMGKKRRLRNFMLSQCPISTNWNLRLVQRERCLNLPSLKHLSSPQMPGGKKSVPGSWSKLRPSDVLPWKPRISRPVNLNPRMCEPPQWVVAAARPPLQLLSWL